MTSPMLQVEALLFSSGKTMTIDQIVELSKMDKQKVLRALKALQDEYKKRDGAIEIENDGTTWRMTVRTEHLPLVKNIVADTELSRACMETLAVIAYKYPKALQSGVVDTRGSGAYDHIAELERLGFIRKEQSGRSFNLKLTEKFFNYFDLKNEKEIKGAFKGIVPPERQKTLDMEVVDVVEKPKGKPLDGMEVVEVQPAPEKPLMAEPKAPELIRPEMQTDDAHKKFLDDLDARISNLSKRNDEHEQDPLFKRKLPTEEQTEEQIVPQSQDKQ